MVLGIPVPPEHDLRSRPEGIESARDRILRGLLRRIRSRVVRYYEGTTGKSQRIYPSRCAAPGGQGAAVMVRKFGLVTAADI